MTYEIIKDLCTKNGTTITALEKELGFGRGSIGKLQKGSKVSGDRLKKIADHFGVTVSYLMDGGKEGGYYLSPETAAMAQTLFEQPGMRILFDAARDSKPEDLAMAADLLRRLKETNPDG